MKCIITTALLLCMAFCQSCKQAQQQEQSAILNPGQLLLSAVGSLTQPLFNAGVNMEE